MGQYRHQWEGHFQSRSVQKLPNHHSVSTAHWLKASIAFKPNVAIDERFEDGYERMRRWAKSKNEPDSYVWARGNLDQLVLDSMEEQLQIEPIFPFKRWRDVRTAVDFLTGTTNGYCKVNYPGFDPYLHITKHNPIDDCVLDVMQLIYGVKE